jgi:hypothetical protein
MSGGVLWEISLRNNWTRYVPVGNMFSGLYCPVKEQGINASGYHKVGSVSTNRILRCVKLFCLTDISMFIIIIIRFSCLFVACGLRTRD